AAGAFAALLLGLLVARRLTRPISALTRGVARVAAGDLSQELPVRSRDEVGQLTRAFNEMVAGLRQRDFIRNAFGRYVSPEVAKTLLESPEGLRLGGHKRVVTVLMSDLRGYTRFAEQGDPAWVMEVLNDYLARMADIVIAHGGTINEFIGDAIFAVFGAPRPRRSPSPGASSSRAPPSPCCSTSFARSADASRSVCPSRTPATIRTSKSRCRSAAGWLTASASPASSRVPSPASDGTRST